MTWWKQYEFIGDTEYLSNFTEKEFTERIPEEILYCVGKITIAETTEWSKYFDKYDIWPTAKQWNKAREIKAWRLADFEKMILSCDKEEHW